MPDERPWHRNKGERPPAPPETLVEVTFANGNQSRQPYRIDQLKWEIRGWDFDVAQSRRA